MEEHSITGNRSWYLESFDLKDNDAEDMRNFPACSIDNYYDLEDIRNGDWSGSTDTDMRTENHKDLSKTEDHSRSKGKENPYSKVNQTMGKNTSYSKSSSPRQKDPNKKPKGIKSPLKDPGNRGS